MITNNFYYVIFHITVQLFHQYYYDEVAQVKCSLSSERWRFESIINQLVSYSSHKPHSPAKLRCWSTIQVKSQACQEPHVPGGRPTALWPYHRAPISCHYYSGTVHCG
jgi:hypothetical protein